MPAYSRDARGRFAPTGSSHRAAAAVLGPAYKRTAGGGIAIAGRKATPADITKIRHAQAERKAWQRAQRQSASQSNAFTRGLNRMPSSGQPKHRNVGG